ncbi:MAG: hypothetical protein J1E80_09625 [Desulfovibrionaceae bacterium]|nr:hypothetical protein [Desulfovibrionaceae bacterium]
MPSVCRLAGDGWRPCDARAAGFAGFCSASGAQAGRAGHPARAAGRAPMGMAAGTEFFTAINKTSDNP